MRLVKSATPEDYSRAIRLKKASARGIRLVPPGEGPEFKSIPFACDVRPARCDQCDMPGCSFATKKP